MFPADTEAQVYLICAVALLIGFVAAAAAAVRSLTAADRERQLRLRAERRVTRLKARVAAMQAVDDQFLTAPIEAPQPVTAPWATAPTVLVHGVRREHGGLW